jgi:hypothetical protein
MRAQRHTQKKVELENTLPKRWWIKGALERGRVRKCITQKMMVKH